MVAKTVAVDPHLSDGSVEFGKVPPSHGRIGKPLSKMLQVGRSASDQDDALQSNPKPTETASSASPRPAPESSSCSPVLPPRPTPERHHPYFLFPEPST